MDAASHNIYVRAHNASRRAVAMTTAVQKLSTWRLGGPTCHVGIAVHCTAIFMALYAGDAFEMADGLQLMPGDLVFGLTPRTAAVIVGGGLGFAFGVVAQRTRFCLRRAIAGDPEERSSALGVWAMALAVAISGTGLLLATALIDLSGHRFLAPRLPFLAVIAGGVMFGVGMVLTRGCASRLTVLAGTGNLRAATSLIVFAVLAHATLKGVLAPVRTTLGAVTIDLGARASLSALPGGAVLWCTLAAIGLIVVAWRSEASIRLLLGGAAIGALAPLGWLATGWLLKDDFDPIPLESIALTSAGAETLFWWVASSAIPPTFGVGFLGGILAGSCLAAVASREFKVTGFTDETPTGNYLVGAALMGLGGVLAGGCTVGAGLSGVGTLSVSAIIALASIVAGGLAASAVMRRSRPPSTVSAGLRVAQ